MERHPRGLALRPRHGRLQAGSVRTGDRAAEEVRRARAEPRDQGNDCQGGESGTIEEVRVSMLELRPVCENCNKPLPPDATDARICSFECTFCAPCVDAVLADVCPNCGGGFAPRPIR